MVGVRSGHGTAKDFGCLDIRRALVPRLQRSHRFYFVVYQEGNVVRTAFSEDPLAAGLLTGRKAPKWKLIRPPILQKWRRNCRFP